MVLLKGIPFPVMRRAVTGYNVLSFDPLEDQNRELLHLISLPLKTQGLLPLGLQGKWEMWYKGECIPPERE